MATVLDTFIVELGLDPTKFNKGQQDAMERFRKTQEEAEKRASGVERVGGRIEETYAKAKREVLAFGAALLGAAGVKEFIQSVVHTDVAVGRLSTLIGTNSQTLTQWRNVAEQTGGSADGIGTSIRGLVQQFQTFAMTGESNVIPYFRALGVDIADVNGHMRPMNDLMLDLAGTFQNMDPSRAAFFGHALGFDDATVALLIRGRTAVKDLLEEQKKHGLITKEDTDAANALTKSWNAASASAVSFGRDILTSISPALTTMLDKMTELFDLMHRPKEQADKEFHDITVSKLGSPKSFVKWLIGPKTAEELYPDEQGKRGPAAATPPTGPKTRGDPRGLIPFIRSEAIKYGIDPDVAVRVAQSEGLTTFKSSIPGENSFGAFQLYTGGGLGNVFKKETGLDPSDPKNEQATISWALKYAASHGWGPWHGAANTGIAMNEGIGHSSSHSVHIENLTVHSAAKDASGIAQDISNAVGRESFSQQANAGAQ